MVVRFVFYMEIQIIMATTITQAFNDYKSNLEIRNRQVTLVAERRKNVVAALAKGLFLHPEQSKLIGSYDRNTMTRYLKEGDVDVLVVLHYGENKVWDNPEGTIKALDCFRSILDKEYPYTAKRRAQNCITMQFSEFRLDVVPAFKMEGGYYKIPDSVHKEWIYTDPFQFAEKITEVNKNMQGTFVPLIKMVKGWNRQVSWPIRSFHLECMLYNHYRYRSESYTYPYMLKEFFASLTNYLTISTYDPIMGQRVDSYLDNSAQKTRREIAIEKTRAAAAAAKEAYEDQEKYPTIAITEWKSLLGDFFPAYG